jgi:hypothetical protein
MEGLEAGLETAGAAALEMAVAATLERGGKVNPCKNCAAPVLGPYCAACGQPTDVHRRSIIHLLHDLFEDIASFDSRIMRTARALFLQPGELSLAFHEGRTQRYVPAVRLYLFVSLVFFLFLSITHTAILQLELKTTSHRYSTDGKGNVFIQENGITKPMDGLKVDKNGTIFADTGEGGPHFPLLGMKADGHLVHDINTQPYLFSPIRPPHKMTADLRGALDRQHAMIAALPLGNSLKSWLGEHLDRMLEALATDPTAVNGPMTEWIPRVLFVLLPVFALILALFYWRQRKTFYFVDHLVFSLNMHSFGFAMILVTIILTHVMAAGMAAQIALWAIALYLFLAMKRFYRQGWIWTAVKFALVSFIYGVMVLVPALTGILLASLFNV